MDLQFDSSVIFCSDLKLQREFYETFLNQEVEMDLGLCLIFKSHFSLWQLTDDFPISRELGYTYEHLGNRNLEMCFKTDNFEDAVEKVLLSELRILHNVEEEQWGQYTIRFYDPEGNLVEIGESMNCFVKRMHNSGMDEKQIAEKTGLKAENITEILK
jgi:catechol 2,3-dioxygenase-like lactoylglutathione lyase family enzyme